MKLILASRNKKKIKEMEALLSGYVDGVQILSLDDIGFEGDIEENGERRTVLGCQHHIECDTRIYVTDSEKAHQLLVTEIATDADFNPRLRKVTIPRSALQAPMGGYDFDCLKQAVSHQIGVEIEPLGYDLIAAFSALVHKSAVSQIAAIVDGSRIIDLREGSDDVRLMGLAIDIGTTSVVAFLYDLETGALVDHCSSLNGQCRYGADVISRIEHTERDADGLALEQRAIFKTIDVIGDVAPIGFCGSGIIDLVATLFDIGVINKKGAFVKGAARDAHPLGLRVRESEEGRRFVLVEADEHPDGREVSITLKDIRAIQLAKSAIYTGCTLITGTYGINPSDIEEICLAGAFGNYIDIPNAQLIGLLPSIPNVPIVSMGNGAGLGAQHYLLSKEVRMRADAIRRNTTHIELASDPNFTDVYMKGMAFEQYSML